MANEVATNAARAAFLDREVDRHNAAAKEWRERAKKEDDEAEVDKFYRYAQRRDYLCDVLRKEAARLKYVINSKPQPKQAV